MPGLGPAPAPAMGVADGPAQGLGDVLFLPLSWLPQFKGMIKIFRSTV